MYITKHTDYAFRTLMLLGLLKTDERISIVDISEQLKVSKTHMMKVVNRLANLQLVDTTRGRNGGVKLERAPAEINVGKVFRQLEEINEIIGCDDGPCLLKGPCQLDSIFHRAADAFIVELDKHTLEDLLKRKTQMRKILWRDVKR